MMASRGMGKISPSKMPKSKTITRKDGDKVSLYKKGGKVKKFAGDDDSLVDDSENMSAAKMAVKDFQSKGIGRTSIPDQQIEEGLNVTPRRLSIKEGSIGGNAAYTKALSKDSFVKVMADADLRRGGSRANKIGAEYTMKFAEGGLYDNINAKRKRIAAGSNEKMRKPGSKGAPTNQAFVKSAKTAKK